MTVRGPAQRKGVAIFDDKIIVPTSDAHILALETKTGRLLWDHEIDTQGETDFHAQVCPHGGEWQSDYWNDRSDRCGRWQFYYCNRSEFRRRRRGASTPSLGQMSQAVIAGTTCHSRNAPVALCGTLAAMMHELNLLYFGPAPTYDTNSLRVRSDAPGVTTDALYTNSTIALNADTGELVWHYPTHAERSTRPRLGLRETDHNAAG